MNKFRIRRDSGRQNGRIEHHERRGHGQPHAIEAQRGHIGGKVEQQTLVQPTDAELLHVRTVPVEASEFHASAERVDDVPAACGEGRPNHLRRRLLWRRHAADEIAHIDGRGDGSWKRCRLVSSQVKSSQDLT